MQNIIDVNVEISNTLIENPCVSNLAIYNSWFIVSKVFDRNSNKGLAKPCLSRHNLDLCINDNKAYYVLNPFLYTHRYGEINFSIWSVHIFLFLYYLFKDLKNPWQNAHWSVIFNKSFTLLFINRCNITHLKIFSKISVKQNFWKYFWKIYKNVRFILGCTWQC